jgi:hypothetical protein
MVFIYPPPEYFKHISKDPESTFFDSGNGYCKRVECMDTFTTYYTLPDSQELLSTHMGYNPPQNWNTYQYALQQRTFKEGIWDAYIIDSKGFSVQFLGRKKGVLNAYKLIYKHFLSILKKCQ